MIVLSGCSKTQVAVSNPAPAPWFYRCETILWLQKNNAPDVVVGDAVRTTNVMKKLQTLQPEADREKLGNCTTAPSVASPSR